MGWFGGTVLFIIIVIVIVKLISWLFGGSKPDLEILRLQGRTCQSCPRFQGSGGLSYCPVYRNRYGTQDPNTVTCEMWGHS